MHRAQQRRRGGRGTGNLLNSWEGTPEMNRSLSQQLLSTAGCFLRLEILNEQACTRHLSASAVNEACQQLLISILDIRWGAKHAVVHSRRVNRLFEGIVRKQVFRGSRDRLLLIPQGMGKSPMEMGNYLLLRTCTSPQSDFIHLHLHLLVRAVVVQPSYFNGAEGNEANACIRSVEPLHAHPSGGWLAIVVSANAVDKYLSNVGAGDLHSNVVPARACEFL
mmetsp:Transcript_11719/g.31582  ORF Transcript_11719/g.31582 Transcript_11719/m.31582 type:complete len:221 (+) Transcript_11719:118-780(+)